MMIREYSITTKTKTLRVRVWIRIRAGDNIRILAQSIYCEMVASNSRGSVERVFEKCAANLAGYKLV